MAVRRGLYFNGHFSYLDAVSVINSCGKNFTICFKFIPEKPLGSNIGYLYSETGNSSSSIPLIDIGVSQTGLLKVNVRDNDGSSVYYEFNINFGDEYKLCVRYDGARLKLNLNNKYVEVSGVLGDITVTNPAYIGQESHYFGSFYRGIVKQGLFYNRPLTDDETEQILGTTNDENYWDRFPTKGLVAFYNLELGHTLDLSGNNNHATPHDVEFVGINKKAGVWFPAISGQAVKVEPVLFKLNNRFAIFADVEIWKQTDSNGVIYGEYNSSTIAQARLYVRSDQKIAFFVRDSSGISLGTNTDKGYEGRHIVGVIKNGSDLSIWVDGRVVWETTMDIPVDETLTASIGRHPGNWYFFKGMIRRLAIAHDWEAISYLKRGILDKADVSFYDFTFGFPINFSNYSNNGQLVGDAKIIGVHSKSGLWFPGTSGSYLDAGNIFAGAQQLAIGIEFYPMDLISRQGLLSKWEVLGGREWMFFILNGYLNWAVFLDNSNSSIVSTRLIKKTVRIIGIYDTVNGVLALYKNGFLVSSTTISGNVYETTKNICIGKYDDPVFFWGAESYQFKGLIKSVWLKTIIPTDIHNEFFNWGANADAFWDFTTGSLKDQSGNGHDLAAYGDVKFIGVR